MKIARVIGSVTGTIKDGRLVGQKLLVVDVVDASGAVLKPSQVVTDTCGAGTGDMVLLASGSAARIPPETSGVPTDETAVMLVEAITVNNQQTYQANSD